MSHSTVRSWGIAVFAIGCGFFVGGVAGDVGASWVGLWNLPISGFTAAFSVVVVAYLIAPAHSIEFSLFSFVVGAGVALWLFRNGSWYPEHYSHLAYQTTYLPLWSTLAGGVAGILAVLAFSVLRKRAYGLTTHLIELARSRNADP